MFFSIFSCKKTCGNKKLVVILQCKSRDGAVVARWAHNPKVVSSSLAPATKEDKSKGLSSIFYSVLVQYPKKSVIRFNLRKIFIIFAMSIGS